MVVRHLPTLVGLLATAAAFVPMGSAACWRHASTGPMSARGRALEVGIGHEAGRAAPPLRLPWFRDDDGRLTVTWQATTDG